MQAYERSAGTLEEIEKETAGLCFHCGKKEEPKESQRCARCRVVYYCSKKCQVEDWKRGGHKQACIEYKE